MFQLERSIEVLSRTPGTLQAMLGGMSDFWTKSNYGVETFSPFDVVGHLIEAEESNWMVRLRVILEQGDAVAFPAFDRYAMFAKNENNSIDELLRSFAELRARNIAELQSYEIKPELLARPGKHPELGAVTLQQLLSAWVVHDLGHLHQVAKAMAYQYRDEVGPWREFLTILPRS